MEYKHRTTEKAMEALSNFCAGVGTRGDKSIHIFTIPVDEERDADCVLHDVIKERDALQAALEKILEALNPDDGPTLEVPRMADVARARAVLSKCQLPT